MEVRTVGGRTAWVSENTIKNQNNLLQQLKDRDRARVLRRELYVVVYEYVDKYVNYGALEVATEVFTEKFRGRIHQRLAGIGDRDTHDEACVSDSYLTMKPASPTLTLSLVDSYLISTPSTSHTHGFNC